MCISTPKVGATNVPAPTDASANSLQLGTAALTRNGGITGRLALTGGQRAARADAAATAGTPTDSTTSPAPEGTVGLPSDYLGRAVFGGLKPKVGG